MKNERDIDLSIFNFNILTLVITSLFTVILHDFLYNYFKFEPLFSLFIISLLLVLIYKGTSEVMRLSLENNNKNKAIVMFVCFFGVVLILSYITHLIYKIPFDIQLIFSILSIKIIVLYLVTLITDLNTNDEEEKEDVEKRE